MPSPESHARHAAYAAAEAAKKSFDEALSEAIKTGELEEVTQRQIELSAKIHRLRELLTVVDIAEAKELLGTEFFGPEAIEKTFHIKIEAKDIPEIPFSKNELKRAKELGQFLILRVDKAADGKPLTMKKMEEVTHAQSVSNQLNSAHTKEDFYRNTVAKPGWALVSRNVLPQSTGHNFFNQTAILADYLRDQVFQGMELPEEYQEALAEFEEKRDALEPLSQTNVPKATKQLLALSLNRLTRQTPVEVLYDLLTYHRSSNNYTSFGRNRLLEQTLTWTPRLASNGKLITIGKFNADGVKIEYEHANKGSDTLGVSFSRTR